MFDPRCWLQKAPFFGRGSNDGAVYEPSRACRESVSSLKFFDEKILRRGRFPDVGSLFIYFKMIKKIILFTKNDLFKSLGTFFIFLVVAIVVMHYFSIDTLRGWVDSFGVFGILIFILAKTSALVFAPINGTPIYLVGWIAYGPVWGFFWSIVGDTLGAIISFFLARKIGRVWVDKIFSGHEEGIIKKILNMFSTKKGIVYGHVLCAAFPDILNYAAGLSKTSLRTYLAIHIPFNIVGILGVMYFSDIILGLGSKGIIWIMLAGVLLAVLGLWIINKYFSKVEVEIENN